MQSSLKMDLNFRTGEPFINILHEDSSGDLKDRAVGFFFEKMETLSRWAKVTPEEYPHGGETTVFSRWSIKPITPEQLREEAALMLAAADEYEIQKARLNKQ